VGALAAGIGAAGSVLGAVTGGKGAKKVAKIQQQTAEEQIAANNANMQKITGLEQPTIDRGNSAGTEYSGLLGLGGDPAASKAALDTFRGSSGYQDLLNTGLGAVSADAYAKGLGDSGATLKALQAKGMNIADTSQQQYLGNLGTLMNLGNSAIGNIAGVSTQTTQANNAANQNAADASGNAALTQSAALQKALSGLTSAGSSFASSYGSGGLPNFQFGGQAPISVFNNPNYAQG
jgi:hypothetical protein